MEKTNFPTAINAMCWQWHYERQKIWEDLKQERWKVLKEYVQGDAYYRLKDDLKNFYMRTYWNKYYGQNKEKINKNRRVSVKCECGSEIRKCGKSAHEKSKKHQQYLVSK